MNWTRHPECSEAATKDLMESSSRGQFCRSGSNSIGSFAGALDDVVGYHYQEVGRLKGKILRLWLRMTS
jgi:hypothetical protein